MNKFLSLFLVLVALIICQFNALKFFFNPCSNYKMTMVSKGLYKLSAICKFNGKESLVTVDNMFNCGFTNVKGRDDCYIYSNNYVKCGNDQSSIYIGSVWQVSAFTKKTMTCSSGWM